MIHMENQSGTFFNRRHSCYSAVIIRFPIIITCINRRPYFFFGFFFSILILFFLTILCTQLLETGSNDWYACLDWWSNFEYWWLTFFGWWRHFCFWDIYVLLICGALTCPRVFSNSITYIYSIILGLVDLALKYL